MFAGTDRVYVNDAARHDLQWNPKYNFAYVMSRLKEGADLLSPISKTVGSKGYHSTTFDDGPYPVK